VGDLGTNVRRLREILGLATDPVAVFPYRDGRLSFSLGCYGCREATDLGPQESVLGFPGSFLDALVARKTWCACSGRRWTAIGTSRSSS
jgi:uncharacterized protein (DUF169 family)